MRKSPPKARSAARTRRGRPPGRDDIRKYLEDAGGDLSEHDLARAFGVRGRDRLRLKRILRDLEAEGALPGRRSGAPPSVAVLDVTALD
ncbi:MAG: ribonuclease R, partial [Geminicoccaceae bacterium]